MIEIQIQFTWWYLLIAVASAIFSVAAAYFKLKKVLKEDLSQYREDMKAINTRIDTALLAAMGIKKVEKE